MARVRAVRRASRPGRAGADVPGVDRPGPGRPPGHGAPLGGRTGARRATRGRRGGGVRDRGPGRRGPGRRGWRDGAARGGPRGARGARGPPTRWCSSTTPRGAAGVLGAPAVPRDDHPRGRRAVRLAGPAARGRARPGSTRCSRADGIDELLGGFLTRPRSRLRCDEDAASSPWSRTTPRSGGRSRSARARLVTRHVTAYDPAPDPDWELTGPAVELYLRLWNRAEAPTRGRGTGVTSRPCGGPDCRPTRSGQPVGLEAHAPLPLP